jgi:hypothetical protein
MRDVRSDIGRAVLAAVLTAGVVACSSTLPQPSFGDPETASPRLGATVPAEEEAGPRAIQTEDWQLLVDMARVAEGGTIEVDTGQDEFIDAWVSRYPGRVVAATRLDDPIFVTFNLVVQDGCPDATIDAIVLDRQAGLVFGEFTRRPDRANCGDIGGDHTFVVAIRRAALPRGRVTFRLEREFFRCPDCGREREQVEVEL